MKKTILAIILATNINATELNTIRDVLKVVESNNNLNAIGDNGKAYGVLQIHHIAIKEVNNYFGTTYTHEDAFQENCANEIYNLYISIGIVKYYNKYKSMPSEKRIVQNDNGYYVKCLRVKNKYFME